MSWVALLVGAHPGTCKGTLTGDVNCGEVEDAVPGAVLGLQ
jgi:hypothetical protein